MQVYQKRYDTCLQHYSCCPKKTKSSVPEVRYLSSTLFLLSKENKVPPTSTSIRHLITWENTKDTFVYFSERRKQGKVAASGEAVLQDKNIMEDRHQPSIKTHRPASSPLLSWSEGVKFTKSIFENFIPYADEKEQTVEDVANAFHVKNQKFLKTSHASHRKPEINLASSSPHR